MTPPSSETADAAPTGTVTGPVTAGDYQVGRSAVLTAEAIFLLGVVLAGCAALTPATVPFWLLPAVVLAGLAALLVLSRGDPAARSVRGRLCSGLVRAARPELRPATGAAGRTTRVQRFQLVELDGTRLTCEFVGPRRKRAPEQGAIAEVHGSARPDGTLRVTRLVYAADGSEFRPRPDLGFALARLATGAGTVAGAALLVASLSFMTARTF